MAKNKPNILFFFSDQHSVHHLGCYGDKVVKIPNLGKLAKSGTLFENAPLCVPSRSALMTGKYTKNKGMYENDCLLDDRLHKSFATTLSENFIEMKYLVK